MYFIIFDLEFNQDFSVLQELDKTESYYPFEIIQIGAVKLDLELKTVAFFNRYIKPTFYKKVSPFISELTGITTEQLMHEEPFPEIYKAFIDFMDGSDSVFCIWGMGDIKELLRNVEDHQLGQGLIPKLFIDLQFYVSRHLNLPKKNLLGLQHAVDVLNIPKKLPFHNALNDASYTAEVFKKIYNSSIQPQIYKPSYKIIRAKQPKREMDFDKLLKQFEKMYARKITEEEKGMIMLAYKMGRTNQFLK